MCKIMKTPYFIYNEQLRMNNKKAAVEGMNKVVPVRRTAP